MTHTHTAHTHTHTHACFLSYTHIYTCTHTQRYTHTRPHGAKKQGLPLALTDTPGLPQKLGMRESAWRGTWSCMVSSSLWNVVALEVAFLGKGLQETAIRRSGFVAVYQCIWKHNYRTPALHSNKDCQGSHLCISILTITLLRSFFFIIFFPPEQSVQMLSVALFFLA